MRRFIGSALASCLLLAGLAGTAAAASSETFGWDDGFEVQHACDIVETVSMVATGRAYFDNDGNWVRDIIRFQYAVTYEQRGGETLVTRTTQVVEVTPETGTLRGQGAFIRGGVVGGVALPDVGRLVFDPGDGSTLFASAKVLPLDDPDAAARIDAALCAAFD